MNYTRPIAFTNLIPEDYSVTDIVLCRQFGSLALCSNQLFMPLLSAKDFLPRVLL